MQRAFVFPGQGSQAIGMLNDFFNHRTVQNTLEEASGAIGTDIGKLIKEGPKEALDLTTNTQPVMLAASVAIYRRWCEEGGINPIVLAGHSLGEYSALVAAGVLDFSDAVQIVRFRARFMQEAVPVGQGAMAAILGLDDETVRTVCQESAQGQIVEAVNYNAPAQVVIAGDKNAVERACILAKERGAKRALTLPVSAPFHSSLLQPASLQLRAKLTEFTFNAPQIPLINNVDVKIENDPTKIIDALVRQAARPVRWVETVQKMATMGVTQILECGPGKVLTGLSKRIVENLDARSINDETGLQELLKNS